MSSHGLFSHSHRQRREQLADRPRLVGFGDITQLSVITRDLEGTTAGLARALGVGHFKIASLDEPALFNRTYRSEPSPWSARAAITWVGQTQLEVIQPVGGRSVFDDFLRRRADRHGVQHVYLELDGASYEATLDRLSDAGYPLAQHAQMNAAGKLGILPMPALPRCMAEKHATRFGYTSTCEPLKVDLEVAQFPPGVSQRLALRAMIPERWMPDDGASRPDFETLPKSAPVIDLDGLVVVARDIEQVAAAYGKLTDRPVQIEANDGELLPGSGPIAQIAAGSLLLVLAQPTGGPLAARLSEHGEGIQVVRARTGAGLAEAREALSALGWSFSLPNLADHPDVPFALWISPRGPR